MRREPYKAGLTSKDIFIEKRNIVGSLVAVSDLILKDRGVTANSSTHADEQDASPSKTVNPVLVLGFMEVKTGGIISVGDTVSVADKMLGEIAGFDETHMPNHMNIVIKVSELTGHGLKLGDEVTIGRPKR